MARDSDTARMCKVLHDDAAWLQPGRHGGGVLVWRRGRLLVEGVVGRASLSGGCGCPGLDLDWADAQAGCQQAAQD